MADNNQTIYEPQLLRDANLRDTLIQNPKLFAEKILKSEAVTCSITIPVQAHTKNTTKSITTTIPFYMSSDIGLGTLSNSWDEMINMNNGNAFVDLLNKIQVFQKEAQVSMQSEAMSAKVWKGSKFDGFSVDCLFVSTRRTLNPTKIIRLLASSALPDKLHYGDTTTAQSANMMKSAFKNLISGGEIVSNLALTGLGAIGKSLAPGLMDTASKNGFSVDNAKKTVSENAQGLRDMVDDVGMIAPLYYGVKPGANGQATMPLENTTLTLQIGEWFRASELLVESVSGITFSKEVIAPPAVFKSQSKDLYDNSPDGEDYGYPLWGKCSIKLIPFAMMTKTKYEGYFIDKTNGSAVDNIWSDLIQETGVGNVLNMGKSVINKFNLP